MRKLIACGIASAALAVTGVASAATMIGTYTQHTGADGDIAAAPIGNGSYSAVSSFGGQLGAGQIAGVSGGYNGSEYVTSLFSANAGDALNFYFNYITSDGAGFSDYAFAELLSDSGAHVAWLFTARTQPSGNTSPGFGLPANNSELHPKTTAIQSGTSFSDLGGSSGGCWSAGCGHTGWINSDYTIGSTGQYALRFGVTNYGDDGYDSALAFSGLTVAGTTVPIGTPEPATWALLVMGFGAVGAGMRRKTAKAAFA